MFASLILLKLYNKHGKVQVEIGIFLFHFTQNLESLSKIFWTFPVLRFIENGMRVYKIKTEFYLHL